MTTSATLAMIATLAATGAFIASVFWLIAWADRRSRAGIRTLGQKLGLTVSEPTGHFQVFRKASRADGTLRGMEVGLYAFQTGSGRTRTSWCAFSAYPRTPGRLTFSVRYRGIGAKFLALVGHRKLETGDPEFDSAWTVDTNEPELFKAALVPELLEKLKAAARAGARGGFRLENGLVRYSEIGTFGRPATRVRFEALAELTCDLAEAADVIASAA